MALMIICAVSVSDPVVQLLAEPGLSDKLICGIVVIHCDVIFRVEPPCVTCVLEKYRKLKLSFHATRPVNEIDQIKSLVDAAVPEQ
jgi:hypothetical protein